MHFYNWSLRRTVNLSAWVLFVLGTTIFLLLASSPHRTRAAFMPVQEVTDTAWFELPPQTSQAFHYENRSSLARFETEAALPTFEGENSLTKVRAIMAWLSPYYLGVDERASALVPESPLSTWQFLKSKNQRGSCHNDSILFSTIAQTTGLQTRLIDFANSDGFGGNGHTVLEIWFPEWQRWGYIDPQQMMILLDVSGEPISALELRSRYLGMDLEALKTSVQIEKWPGALLNEDSLKYTLVNATDIYMLRSADYQSRAFYDPASAIANRIEHLGTVGGWRVLQLGRFIRSVFSKPYLRYRFVDERSPNITFSNWYRLGRIVLITWLFAVLLWLGVLLETWLDRKQRKIRLGETKK